MDRHCSRQSPYQPSAGQVYLDYSRLDRRDDSIDDHLRALDLSSRPLPASELEEHHKREAYLRQQANDRWATIERMHTVEKRAFTALHRCEFPPAKANNGQENTYRQLVKGVLPHSQPKPRPRPIYLAHEDPGQRQSLGIRRSERGYSDFEIADQKRRVARMGLGGQNPRGEGAIPQRIVPPPIREPTGHLFPSTYVPTNIQKAQPAQQMQNQSKAQEQQIETPNCGQCVQKHSNNVLLNAQASQEVGQRKLAQQKREQQKVHFPTAKPGNLYPGPTRIPSILPPIRIVHDDDMDQSVMSELALTVHLKSKMASQEAYRKYKEEEKRKNEENEQRKAASSVPRSEATRAESVKQLLASINTAPEQKVEAAEVGAAKTKNETFRAQSQQPHKGQEDAYEAGLRCGELFWDNYDKSYPIPRQSDGIQCSPSLDSASVQPLIASLDHPIGADESARHARVSEKEVPLDSSRTSDLRAAVEAIDKIPGDLLESPKTVSGQDVSPPPILQTEQNDMSPELAEEEEIFEDAAEAAQLEDVDIQLEWEEVGDSLGDDGWSDVEQDFVDNTISSSSSDVEWASDAASGGAFDF